MTISHRIMSCNINGDNNDGDNAWEKRAPLTFSVINRYKPDLIGFQECTKGNLTAFNQYLNDYKVVEGNCYGDTPPQEYTSILFLKSRYELLDQGEFWFSRTPDIESADWGIDYPMGATWIKLKCLRTDQQLFHLNTHYEDGPWGEQSRINASQLIIDRITQLAPHQPAVITGDFNCNPWSRPYQMFHNYGLIDTYRKAGNADSAESSTLHLYKGKNYFALDFGDEMFWRVDWILALKMRTTSSMIVRDAEPPLYPSDHYLMISEVLVL
jgi:endonuclease/exonuclease/phosphatase family metal-dependent hydrolase